MHRNRWLAALATYDFDVQYRPGKANIDADLLSRNVDDLEDGSDWVDVSPTAVKSICQRVQVRESSDESSRYVEQLHLVCNQQVAVVKEYNIQRHYKTHHKEKYDHLKELLRKVEIIKFLAGLKKQQSTFTRSHNIADGAVRASYLIANKLAQASKPYSDGEFVKTCMLKDAEVVCPEKRKSEFANISLSRNTIADRMTKLSGDLGSQMKDKIKSFISFSVAIDESTNVTDIAQLAIFIRGVDEALTVTRSCLNWCLLRTPQSRMTSSALSLERWTRW